VFWDESGASLLPVTRRTWAPRGHTPVIRHHFKWKRASMAAALCYGSRGGGAAVAFHHQLDAYNTDSLIGALGELRRFLGGEKATLLWDGLPAHRSLAMAAWLRRQRSWLVVEPLPGYAPELNPVEGLWANLKGGELANRCCQTAEEVIATAQVGGPADLVSRYGRKVPVAVSSAPIFDARGRVVGGVDVIRDVSKEREIDEVKSALISTVSHELRTPLTLIHGFAELLVLRDMPVERQRSSAVEILDASRRLARLIDDLLSVSRMESGRLVLDPRPLDLASVVERILSPFRAMAAKHTLRTKLPGSLPVVWGDPDKVEQILTNLVGNAIKYSPGGGEVLVTVDQDGDSVQVSVRDQGIGMSPRDMGQLFEKFYRVDREEVRRAGGTGLGLYITKRLVEMHGGRLWAESWPGVGSVFRFTLPTSDELAGSGR